MTRSRKINEWINNAYPACVGLAKSNGKVKECWNDMKFRKVKWYYNYIPFRWLGWDRKGIKICFR